MTSVLMTRFPWELIIISIILITWFYIAPKIKRWRKGREEKTEGGDT